jgi:hypothetical protein
MDDGERDAAAERWMASDADPVADGLAHSNGHYPEQGWARGQGASAPADDADEAVTRAGGWVSAGGVLRWEPGQGEDTPQAEAHSPLAEENFEMPPGAPDAPRVAAVRAWLLRQREVASEDLGALLLRRREQRRDADPPASRRPRRGPAPPSTVDVELAERQAAFDEYAALADELEEMAAHGAPAHALVEYYLWLADRLDGLLAESRALLAAQPADPLVVGAWNGRAQAVVATRGRVERMMAPAPEE